MKFGRSKCQVAKLEKGGYKGNQYRDHYLPSAFYKRHDQAICTEGVKQDPGGIFNKMKHIAYNRFCSPQQTAQNKTTRRLFFIV